MPAAAKKPKLIVVAEDASAVEVAHDQVSQAVSGANVLDAIDTMVTDHEPDEADVLFNDEIGVIAANLTDKQAKDLESQSGVVVVEDDEMNYAFDDGLDDAPMDDPDALAEIDGWVAGLDDELLEITEESVAEHALLASQLDPAPIDEVEFDEFGELIDLDDVTGAGTGVAGIPPDKVIGLVRCVIKCAAEQFQGQVADVSDDRIAELVSAAGLEGTQERAAAIRDYITCGLRIIYAPQAWRYSTGLGVRVAIVDTGITPRHPDLRVWGGASFVPGVTRWYDDHYHGTHVAGTVAATMNNRGLVGVAPHSRVYAVKVLNSAGSGRTSWILNGLGWCYRNRMHIVNLSLGSGATTHNPRNFSQAYENAGRALRRRGILPVAAAGNSGRTPRPFVGNPARCPSFMAVSSIDCRRRRSPFSSYGPQVEICAPGSSVWSTFPPNRYRQLSGTSMAAPHVAGVAALVKRRRPYWHGDTIRVHLWRTAIDLGSPGRDWFYGYGQVNALRAVV